MHGCVAFVGWAWLLAPPSFEVPAGCGTADGFTAELTRLAGDDAPRATPDAVRIEGPAPDGQYTLRLSLPGETRVLRDADCTTLLRSAAVIAAAAAAPAPAASPSPAPAGGPPPSPSASPAPAPIPSPAPAPSEVPEPPAAPDASAPPSEGDALAADPSAPTTATTRAESARWSGHLGAGAGVAVGVVPRAGALVEVLTGFERRGWGLRLGLHYLSPTRARREGRAVTVMAVGGRLVARRRIVDLLELAAGLELDWLWGRGEEVPGRRSAGVWMLSPSLELALVPLRRRHVRLEIAAIGRVAAVRPRFEVLGYGTVYEPPRGSFLAALRGFWQFP